MHTYVPTLVYISSSSGGADDMDSFDSFLPSISIEHSP